MKKIQNTIKPRNFVAMQKQTGAGVHQNKKKNHQNGVMKHKQRAFNEGSF